MGKVKLESICTIVSGSTPKSSCPEYWGGSIKWVTPAEISDETHYIEDTERHITEEGMRSCHLRMMPSGTVLLSSRAPIGKTAITKSAMCCNQGFKNLICGNSISNEYLYHFLKSKTDELKSIGRGATFKEISKKQVESITINLPALDEQNRRTAALGQIDMLLKQNRKLTGIIDDLVKSRFVEMFGDPIENDSKLPKCKWEDVLTIVNGKNQKKAECATGEYPICGSGGEMGRARQYLTKGDSVIIGRKGNINNPILMREPFWNVDTAFGLEPNADILRVEYLYYYCEWFDFQKLNKAVTIPSLTKADLLKIEMPLPPLALQQEFAGFVTHVDKLRFATQQQIEKLETLKKSLMQEYFG